MCFKEAVACGWCIYMETGEREQEESNAGLSLVIFFPSNVRICS